MRGAFARNRIQGPPAPPDPAVLFAAVPAACLLLDADNRFRAANPAAEQFFALSQTQLRQHALEDLIDDNNPVFGMIALARSHDVMVSERDMNIEGPRLNHRGVAVQAVPVAEEPGAIMLVLSDWSAARALDRQLSFRNAARSVAGMAAILAHEVKNPLSGIRGAAQLLENSVADSDRELAVLIRDEADRIRDLVERMEMFGEKPIERTAVNIHRVLEHVRRLAQTGFATHLRLTESYDPSLPPVWGNRDQLVQVFLNLVKNAAEAITAVGGDGEITLMTGYQPGVRLAAPGSTRQMNLPLVVTLRDNGPGISPEVEKNLFDPFVTTKSGGSGLGLALVAKIIGDHGGLIEVDSRPGRTEFRIFLPIFPEDSPEDNVDALDLDHEASKAEPTSALT
jgi:two-component system, NtrC family, nitrogen regulation sensor histidine kinase GlnL